MATKELIGSCSVKVRSAYKIEAAGELWSYNCLFNYAIVSFFPTCWPSIANSIPVVMSPCHPRTYKGSSVRVFSAHLRTI